MASKTGDYPIPFTRAGDQLSYADRYMTNVVWRDNDPFETVIEFLRFERGRSAAHAIFRRADNGREVTVFLTDLADMIPVLDRGHVIDGPFVFTKKGMNYGLKLHKERT